MNNLVLTLDHTNREVSKENYVFVISSIVSLSGLVHGYLVTFLGLWFSHTTEEEEQVLSLPLPKTTSVLGVTFDPSSITYSSSMILYPYFVGLILGSLLSFPLCDILGRKSVIMSASFCTIFTVIWCCFSLSMNDLFSALMFVGWTLGILLSIAPNYVAEVSVLSCSFISEVLFLLFLQITESYDRGSHVGLMELGMGCGSLLALVMYLILR